MVTRPEREEPIKEEPVREFNLTEPEEHTLTVDGVEYTFTLARYDPPLFHTEIEPDLSTPEGAILTRRPALLEEVDPSTGRKFVLRVDMEYEGRRYAIIQFRTFIEGEELPVLGTSNLVKKGDVWLPGARYIGRHPVSRLVGLHTYEEIREILKEGTWDVPWPFGEL